MDNPYVKTRTRERTRMFTYVCHQPRSESRSACPPLPTTQPRPPLQLEPAMSTTALTIQELQDRLNSASTDYQRIQNELSVVVEARQKLDAQRSENELVKQVRNVTFVRVTFVLLTHLCKLDRNSTSYRLIIRFTSLWDLCW